MKPTLTAVEPIKRRKRGQYIRSTLNQSCSMLDIDDDVFDGVVKMAKEIADGEQDLTRMQYERMVDLALLNQRLKNLRHVSERLKDTDPAEWLKFVAKIQAETALKRGIMRDLMSTKNEEAQAKTKPSGGTGWEGVV